ncbi:hypothetical protein RFI_37972, partial [Reticulomyxa filosa]
SHRNYSKRRFKQNANKILNFTSNSSDLKQIENLWWIVKTKIFKNGPFGSKEKLLKQFELECKKNDKEICADLTKSMQGKTSNAKRDLTKL